MSQLTQEKVHGIWFKFPRYAVYNGKPVLEPLDGLLFLDLYAISDDPQVFQRGETEYERVDDPALINVWQLDAVEKRPGDIGSEDFINLFYKNEEIIPLEIPLKPNRNSISFPFYEKSTLPRGIEKFLGEDPDPPRLLDGETLPQFMNRQIEARRLAKQEIIQNYNSFGDNTFSIRETEIPDTDIITDGDRAYLKACNEIADFRRSPNRGDFLLGPSKFGANMKPMSPEQAERFEKLFKKIENHSVYGIRAQQELDGTLKNVQFNPIAPPQEKKNDEN